MNYFLSAAFRPFFLLASLSAVFVPMYLVCVVLNDYHFNDRFIDVFSWHGHELLFGMIPAVLGGFLLTASATWTKTTPVNGGRLILLILAWIGARVIVIWQPSIELIYFVAPVFLLLLLFQMIKILKGNRNLFVVSGLLSLLLVLQVSYLYSSISINDEVKELTLLGAQFCLFSFLFIFSGRLVPLFTNNIFKRKVSFKSLKLEGFLALGASLVFLLRFFSLSSSVFFQALSLSTALLFILRSWNWYSPLIWKRPMIYFLHISHLWFVFYFSLIAFHSAFPEYNIGRAVFHCLFSGALALFVISIMARVSLGHTGRPIVISRLISLAFYCVLIGGVARVFIPLIRQELYDASLHISMGFWTLGFIFFLLRFASVYFQPRSR